MPADITGLPIKDVYSGFIHLSSANLSNTLETAFDGVGNASPLQLSLTSVSVNQPFINNGLTYPIADGANSYVITTNGAGTLAFTSFSTLLTATSSANVSDGSYSLPSIDMLNGVVSSITNNKATKVFVYTSRTSAEAGPSTTALLSIIEWARPITGDTAIIFQKVYQSNILIDLTIYKFTYASNTWGTPTIL